MWVDAGNAGGCGDRSLGFSRYLAKVLSRVMLATYGMGLQMGGDPRS